MADIQVPLTNWGNLAFQIPGNIANTENVNANTSVQQQQAKSLSLANQLQGMNLNITRAAYARALNDFSGQMTGNEAGNADQSGETSGGAASSSPAAAAASGASGVAGSAGVKGAAATPAAAMAANNENGTQTDEGAPGGTVASPTVPVDTAGITQNLYKRWFVNPAGTPQEQQYLQDMLLTNNPGLVAQAKARINANVATRSAIVKQQSNALFSAMMPVADPSTPHPWTLLDRINPQAAQAVAAAAKRHGVDPDVAARQYAAAVANGAHQFTGRGVAQDQAGVYRDSLTGMPLPNVPQAGLSPYAWSRLATGLSHMETVKKPDGTTYTIPAWKIAAPNATNPIQAMLQVAAKQGGYSPNVPGAQTSVANARAAWQQAQAQTKQLQQDASGVPPEDRPIMVKGLSDPNYNRPSVEGVPTEESKGLQEQYVSNRKELLTDLDEMNESSTQALTYLTAAQQVLDSPNYTPTSWRGGAASVISKAAQSLGITQGNWAANKEKLAKYLGNVAVQSFRQNFGSRPANQEFQIQMHELSPSTGMVPGALEGPTGLIAENTRLMQYALKMSSGAYVTPYLKNKKEPLLYGQWFQHYWPMQKIVNGEPNPNAAPAQQLNGQQAPAPGAQPVAAPSPNASGTNSPQQLTFKNGATMNSKSGKPMVFKNGTWVYK